MVNGYKDVVIKVKMTEDMSKAESGSVLVFDKESKSYYLVSPSELLKTTRQMIEEADEKVRKAQSIQEQTKKREEDFEKSIIEKFNSLSSSLKDSNTKLIDLVNGVVNGTTEDK